LPEFPVSLPSAPGGTFSPEPADGVELEPFPEEALDSPELPVGFEEAPECFFALAAGWWPFDSSDEEPPDLVPAWLFDPSEWPLGPSE
jgi:hypothetical protein